MKTITCKTEGGDRWDDVLKAAILAAKEQDAEAVFDFNGVEAHVRGDSDPTLITRDFHRAMSRYLGENPVIGPYPSSKLSAEEVASDARIEAENEQRRQAWAEEYRRKQEQAEAILKGALDVAPPMALNEANAHEWYEGLEKNRDPYGAAVYHFAEDWARVMQGRLENGGTLEDSAEKTSDMAAQVHGITGFQYGCAVQILARCWEHGEALRRWAVCRKAVSHDQRRRKHCTFHALGMGVEHGDHWPRRDDSH